ncbi:MAG TPA: dihydrolipoamide acetyltransferase family protein, partial [Vicinamibacteria bacterium]|nr:dihydrolipoamide acetyltransferase family protein [Vicinamibacteria bacterium]
MTDVIMPQMGESIAEGTVTKWLKKIGETVKRDEPLFEISTDKVDAEIPSPIAGVLTEILIQPGTTVEVGTVVGRIGVAGSAVAAPPQPPPPAAAPGAPHVSAAPAAPQPARPVAPQAPTPPPLPPPPADAFAGSNFVSDRSREGMTTGELRMARSSPVVRKIAQEYGVDINEVPGTGLGGRVTREDILSYVESRKSAAIRRDAPPAPYAPTPAAAAPPAPARPPVTPPPVPAVVPPPVPRVPVVAPSTAADAGPTTMRFTPVTPAAPGAPALAPAPAAPARAVAPPSQTGPVARPASARVEVVPMSPIRKKTADHMVLSKRTSAHVSTVWEIDMTRVAMLRAKYKPLYEERSGVNLTYTPFIVKAVTDAIKVFKVLNASVDGDSIVYHKDINVGIAVALDWGLIVPVIPAADEKNVLGLSRAVNDLGERARTKKLKVEEVQGGTFTITNPGVFGSLFGTPIIPQPQVAILGVGTIEKRPVVRDDAIAIRTMAYFCLTFDHRIIDGSEADKFMAHVKNSLQNFDESAL